jgi:hypothetical protein
MRDKVFNFLVKRYEKKNHVWKWHDDFIFGGFIYYIWDWIPMLLYIYVTYLVVNYTYGRYGWFRGILVLGVMVLIRINALIRKVDLTNRLLKGKSKDL